MSTTIHALAHLFSSVERGYSPKPRRGFQTVAVAQDLIGTADLEALERAAFYALSRERRAGDDFPVKEAFFRLPSGRFAVGRTVSAGTDSLGREGNYLAHHLVLRPHELAAAGGNPFSILEAADLAAPGMDRTPRVLPPLTLTLAAAQPDFRGFEGLPLDFPASLAIAAVDGGGEQTTLLIGDEARTRRALQSLFAALPAEDRLRLSFSTHFYESAHLRPLFAFAAVGSRAEAPSERQSYNIFDLHAGEMAHVSPASAYADWLADCLRGGRWEEIVALNTVLDQLRAGATETVSPPASAPACAALWERVGAGVTPALVGRAGVVTEFLRRSPAPRPLANALLAAASPSELLGSPVAREATNACLSALRQKAGRKAWRAWVKHWEQEPALGPFVPSAQPWWRRVGAQIQQWKNG